MARWAGADYRRGFCWARSGSGLARLLICSTVVVLAGIATTTAAGFGLSLVNTQSSGAAAAAQAVLLAAALIGLAAVMWAVLTTFTGAAGAIAARRQT